MPDNEQAAQITTASSFQLGRGAANDRRLRLTAPTGNLDLQSDYILSFQTPLRRFDSSLVSLSTDSSFSPVNYIVTMDS